MVNYTPPRQENKTQAVPDKKLKEIMLTSFEHLKKDDDVTNAMELLIKKKLSGVVVLNQQGEPEGFVSEKDCLRVVHEMKYYNSPSRKIGDIMSKFVTTLDHESDIFDAIEIFTKFYFHIIPVVKDGKVCGIVNRNAVLNAVQSFCQTTW